MERETRRENPWLNIGFNIVVPSLLLIKGRRLFELAGVAPSYIDAAVWRSRWRSRLSTEFGIWGVGASSIYFR